MTKNRRSSENYFKKIRECWQSFPQSALSDEQPPEEILKSWSRCFQSGLSKESASRNADHLLSSPFLKPGYGLSEGIRFHSFSIGSGTRKALLAFFLMTPDDEPALPFAEQVIGTNSISLACRLRRGVFVNGPEHYAGSLHDQFSYAEPAFDTKQQVFGVTTITSSSLEVTKGLHFLAHDLASIGKSIVLMALDDPAKKSLISSLINRVPQGLVYIDKNNTIKHYNQAALEAFGLKGTEEDSVIFLRCMTQICNAAQKEQQFQQSATFDYNNNKRKVRTTVLFLSDSPYERLFLLENLQNSKKKANGQKARWTFQDILTTSPLMIHEKEKANRAANHHVPIMLIGKTGVGKELFAQAIHNASPWRNGPFIALNASAISPTLIESELFGYEKGAFTGATREGKAGYFEAASGGTLFLDELDSMPLEVQTKMLRAISSKSIRRVGGSKTIPVDVRLISAGRVDVKDLIPEGKFREDLYYRLSPIKIHIPPLAQRGDDVLLLAREFLKSESKKMGISTPDLSDSCISCLLSYDWPGNVRELHNALRHALVFLEADLSTIEPANLPEYLLQATARNPNKAEPPSEKDESLLKLAKLIAVCEAFRLNKGDVEKTGRQLGISTATVYNYLSRARKSGLHFEKE